MNSFDIKKVNTNKSELKIWEKRLTKIDKFFNDFFGIDSISAIEGITSAVVWGFLIVYLRKVLPIGATATNILAYLLAWYSQQIVIGLWKQTKLFKKRTEGERFLKSKGVDILEEKYEEQNYIHQVEDVDPERFLLIRENLTPN